MFANILVPVDLTDRNQRAFDSVSELARTQDAHVTLLHVVERIDHVPPEELEGFYSELTREAEERLGGWAQSLSDAGVRTEVRVLQGKRAREVLQYASDHDCDLIVMATHAVGPDHPGGSFGTISHQVALLAQCDVLLVRD